MDRIIKTINNNSFMTDDDMVIRDTIGYTGKAVERLATFENIYDDLTAKQIEIFKELEKLRT